MRSDLVEITATIVHETKKAYLINDGINEVWLPKSACEVEPADDGKACKVTLSERLATEKGLL